MLITKRIGIDMGHRVPNHQSKCRHFHGHRYSIEVGVDDKIISTPGTPDEGMVIDFGDLKQIMMEEIDAKFDHGFCMWKNDMYAPVFQELKDGYNFEFQDGREWRTEVTDKPFQKIIFVDFIPTAENLAKHWYELIKPKLAERKIKIKHVKVWETPTSTAKYEEE